MGFLVAFAILGAMALAFKALGLDSTSETRSIAPRGGWSAAARRLGLRYFFDVEETIEGRFEDFYVRVSSTAGASGEFTVLAIDEGGIPEGLWLTRERPWAGAAHLIPRTEDLPTGDPEFDAAIHVRGPEAAAAAILDANTRREVMGAQAPLTPSALWSAGSLRDAKMRVENGAVVVAVPELLLDERRILDLVETGLSLARLLAVDAHDIPARLEHNATADPAEGARARSFALLLARYEATEEANRAARSILSGSSDPRTRLLAARHLGREGFDALRSLVDAADAPVEVRIDALEHLADHAPPESALETVERIAGLPSAPPRLALAAATRSPQLGGPVQEARLIALLEGPDDAVKIGAAEALERWGSRDAVQALSATAASAPILGGGKLREALSRALDAIRSRAGGDSGRLSLAEARGELSIAAERGTLGAPDARDPEKDDQRFT